MNKNEKLNCYKVTVKTTNAGQKTFLANNYHYECLDGIIYVVTSNIKIIAEQLGDSAIEKIEKIGIGYNL